MNLYRNVAVTTREYHEGLMRWSRRVLAEAGLEALEVYGQIPAKGLANSHLVFFPYRVGPDPKVQENAPGTSLLRPRERPGEPSPFVPEAWLKLGAALAEAVEATFRGALTADAGSPRAQDWSPYPRLRSLPQALQRWYERPPDSPEDPWVLDSPDGLVARPPSLSWKQGIPAIIRYLVLAHEPGRGTEERTSASPPIALAALNVLLAGIQEERVVEILTPPQPLPEGFAPYVSAVADAREAAGDPEGAQALRGLLAEVLGPIRAELAMILVQDLNNRELIQLMQALQRPLQSSLNLQVRYVLGSGPLFTPSVWVQAQHRRPTQQRGPARVL